MAMATRYPVCAARDCSDDGPFQAVDADDNVLERRPWAACRRHALKWLHQGHGSIYIFPPGSGEADSLTTAQIRAWA